MFRRTFLTICISVLSTTASPSLVSAANKKFAFKIKTKNGGIVGNVLIEASDVEAAKVKLVKRYPGCMILSVMEK